jgi:hypothetical protein
MAQSVEAVARILVANENEQSRSSNRMEITMVHRVSLALTAVFLSSAAAATAAELPTFETIGFPLTQHQLTVLNSGIVQERSPAPSLTLASMPASPVQIGVLTPRPKQEFAAKEGSPAHN